MSSKNNLFIYSNYDFSERSAGCTRMMYYAKALADKTTQVYLISCTSTSLNEDSFEEIGANIFKPKANQIQTQSFLGSYKFVKNLNLFANTKNDRVTFLFYPSHLLTLEILSLLYLKLLKGKKIFSEFNEVRKYSSTFYNKLSVKKLVYSLKKILYVITFSLIDFLLPFYDGLICISTQIEQYGNKYNKNSIRIPILTDPYMTLHFTESTYAQSNVFNIGFSGSIHIEKERLENFFTVISILDAKNFKIHLNLCGSIKKDHKDYIFEYLLKKLDIESIVNYYGNLNELELNTFLQQQDLLVIPRGFNLQNKYGFSTKLSDYLNHKKPILVTDVSDNNMYIFDKINGFIVPPDDDFIMLEKLIYIIENYDDFLQKIIMNAYNTSKKHFYYKLYKPALTNFIFNDR